MSLKRNALAILLLLLLLVLGAGFLSYSYFLPRYIEKKILPHLGTMLSVSLTGRVYNIGISAADVGDIVVGNAENPALTIGSIHAAYALSSLPAKKLESLTVNGLTLHAEVAGGKITFPGVDLAKFTTPGTGQNPVQEPARIDLPLEPADIRISHGLVVILYKGERFLLPFDLRVRETAGGGSRPVYDLTLQMMLQGGKVSLTGTVDLRDNKGMLTLAADSLEIDRFVYLAGGGENTFDFGPVAIRGAAAINLLPLQLLSADLDISPGSMRFGKTAVRFGPGASATDPAVKLELQGSPELLQVKMKGAISEPLAAILELNGSIAGSDDSWRGTGNIIGKVSAAGPAAAGEQPATLLLDMPEVQADFNLELSGSGTWQAELTNPGSQQGDGGSRTLQLRYGAMVLQAGMPSLSVHGAGTSDTGEIRASFTVPGIQAEEGGAGVSLGAAKLQAVYRMIADSGHGRTASATLDLQLDSINGRAEGIDGRADISLHAEMKPQFSGENGSLRMKGAVTVDRAAVTEHASGITLGAIKGTIPWSWPQTGEEMAGEIQVPDIRWRDVKLGSFRADITARDTAYLVAGSYNSSLLQGVAVKITGKADMTASGIRGKLDMQSPVTSFPAIDLGTVAPALKQYTFSGDVGLNGSLSLASGALHGSMEIQLQNGVLENPEKKYEIRGIAAAMRIPALPDLRTAPAQTMKFTTAAIGNLAFSNGKFVWQLESEKSFFLEEGVVQWAGGRVFTNAVRVSPEMDEIVVPIFCDRLKLTDLLHQFGISDAAGEGTVNGRIPLRIGKNTIRFEDGFLYSSPGQGGSIKVAALDLLSSGIPKNSPQFAQVDFAAEALKNFQYNWVKLLFNTEGEELVMKMQMDGKPVQSLPFTYDSTTGSLRRSGDSTQGINQPIRLDVNFRLPFNRLLGYSGKIQEMMKKVK